MTQKIARIHNIPLSSRWNLKKSELENLFHRHNCDNCTLYMSVLEPCLSPALKKKRIFYEGVCSLDQRGKG